MPYKNPKSPEAIACFNRSSRKYESIHREERRQQKRDSYKLNREKELLVDKVRRELYKEIGKCIRCGKLRDRGTKLLCSQCAPLHAQKTKSYHTKVKLAALDAYGERKCACCGESRLEFLTIDHINNDGAAHRKSIGGGGIKLYMWLKQNSYPVGFRVLCWNCNSSLGCHGYCPHQREGVKQ